MMNRKGQLADSVMMMYRLVLITIIAFIIFGISAVYYTYHIDVRDSEAGILNSKIVNCLAPEGFLDLNKIKGNENKLFDYCEMSNMKRYYVGVEVFEGDKSVVKISGGDSGALWVKKIFENLEITKKIRQYEPGFFSAEYPVVVKSDRIFDGKIKTEVLVNNEE